MIAPNGFAVDSGHVAGEFHVINRFGLNCLKTRKKKREKRVKRGEK